MSQGAEFSARYMDGTPFSSPMIVSLRSCALMVFRPLASGACNGMLLLVATKTLVRGVPAIVTLFTLTRKLSSWLKLHVAHGRLMTAVPREADSGTVVPAPVACPIEPGVKANAARD